MVAGFLLSRCRRKDVDFSRFKLVFFGGQQIDRNKAKFLVSSKFGKACQRSRACRSIKLLAARVMLRLWSVAGADALF